MAGFLYYLPNDGPKTRPALESAGFPHADSIELPGCGCTPGPDGLNGAVTKLRDIPVSGGQAPVVGHYSDKQTWHQILDGKMWLGWETENPPTPIDLQRKKIHGGHSVMLTDEKTWIMPVVRTLIGEAALSPVLTCDSSGKVLRERVDPEFSRIWDLTKRAFAAVSTDPPDTSGIDDDEVVELLFLGLAINYRVSRWEVLNLGLLSARNMEPLLGAMMDIPAMAIAAAAAAAGE